MGKKGPVCTICQHKARAALEVGLVHRVPLRVLAARYKCSADALHRHRHNHLSPAVAAAILSAEKPTAIDLEQLQTSESTGLLTQLVTQRARLQQAVEFATGMGDIKAATAAERAITGNLELVSKLLGQLVTRHEVCSTSLLVSPDYLKLRQVITTVLRRHPQAAIEVGAALHALEQEAAAAIKASGPTMIEGRAA